MSFVNWSNSGNWKHWRTNKTFERMKTALVAISWWLEWIKSLNQYSPDLSYVGCGLLSGQKADEESDSQRFNRKKLKPANSQRLYPCSTKTREVLGNPSPTAERFPET